MPDTEEVTGSNPVRPTKGFAGQSRFFTVHRLPLHNPASQSASHRSVHPARRGQRPRRPQRGCAGGYAAGASRPFEQGPEPRAGSSSATGVLPGADGTRVPGMSAASSLTHARVHRLVPAGSGSAPRRHGRCAGTTLTWTASQMPIRRYRRAWRSGGRCGLMVTRHREAPTYARAAQDGRLRLAGSE
jgi:hypothetical protein